MRRVVACALGAVALAGCSSTTEKAARIADEGSDAFEAEGLAVTRVNADVQVQDTQVLRDANGTAVVVVLRSRARRALRDVPIALDVADRAGASIWKNDAPGLEGTLVSLPVLPRGAATSWVNDQVLPAAGEAATATARVGRASAAPAELPEVRVGRPRLEADPVDGVAARGEVTNASRVDQRDLVVYGLARKGGEVVAAGRAIVPRVRAGARAPYAIFFIGDPSGAELEVSAPPTTLGDGG